MVIIVLVVFTTLSSPTSPYPSSIFIRKLATGIGSVTATGSVVAYGKLNGSLDSGAMNLSGRDQVPRSTTDLSSA